MSRSLKRVLFGEVSLPSEWREADDRYGVGDYVTRNGTDIQRVISLDGPDADTGEFLCVKEPAIYEACDEPWAKIGTVEFNLTRRYKPVEITPEQRKTYAEIVRKPGQ